MNRKAYYFILFSIALSALCTGLLFLPSSKDLALMYLYHQEFAKANRTFGNLYEKGDHSLAVVMPYTWLQLQYAESDKAIEVLEGYVEETPKSFDAREYLGKLYLHNSRPFDYLQNLQEMYRLQPSSEILREEEKMYRRFGDEKHEIETLKTIVEKYDPKEQEYVELANLYASQGEIDMALLIVNHLMLNISPVFLQSQTAQFVSNLLLRFGQERKSLDVASQYVHGHLNVDSVIAFARIMESGNMLEEAKSFVDLLPDEKKSTPAVLELYVDLLNANDQEKQAYSLMKRHFTAGTLPKSLVGNLLFLAVTFDDQTLYLALIEKAPVENLAFPTLLTIAEKSVVTKDPRWVYALEPHVEEDFLESHLELKVALSLADPNLPEETDLSPDNFSDSQKFFLALLFKANGDKERAKLFLEHVNSFEEISHEQLYRIANLYAELDLVDQGLVLLNQLSPDHEGRDQAMKVAWLILATAFGDSWNVATWLDAHPDTREITLQDVYFTAVDHHRLALGQHVGYLLEKRYPSRSNRRLFAEVILLGGNGRQAVPLFRTLLAEGEDVEEEYFSALNIAAKSDSDYLDELQHAIHNMLQKENLSDEKKREIGFILVEHDWKEEAIPIFLSLAHDESIDDDDVQTLLWLWGDTLDDQALSWVEERAQKAHGKNRAKWLQTLLDTHHPELVLSSVREEEWSDQDIRQCCFDALIAMHKKQELSQMLVTLSSNETKVEALEAYVKIAIAEDLPDMPEVLYQKILDVEPYHETALRELGKICFSCGKWCQAKYFLSLYLDRYEGDYLSEYDFGELLWFHGHKQQARCFYRSAYTKLPEKKTIDDQMVEAQLLYRLGCIHESISLYCQLTQEHPLHLPLYSAFAELLIDQELFGEAAFVLSRAKTSCDDNQNAEAVDVDLTRMGWFIGVNRVQEALSVGCRLLGESDAQGAVYAAVGDAEQAMGRWRRANEFYECACRYEPYNEGFSQRKYEVLKEYLPYISAEYEYRKTGDNEKEHFQRYIMESYVHSNVKLRIMGEVDCLSLDEFQRAKDGKIVSFDGERGRGEVSGTYYAENGLTGAAALYFTDGVVGVGGRVTRPDPYGRWIFVGEYRATNWDYFETTVQQGSRNRLLLAREQRVGPWVSGSIYLAYNSYRLKSVGRVASSYSFGWDFNYRLPRYLTLMRRLGDDTYLSLNYQLDSEYKITRKKRVDLFENKFAPLPLDSREVHTFSLFCSRRFHPCFAMEGYAGYAYDRAEGGGVSPVGAISGIIGREKGWMEGRLDYSHTASSQGTDDTVDSVVGKLRASF